MGQLLTAAESPVFEPAGAHARLYADRAFYSGVAGIAESWIWQPLAGVACANEVQFITGIKSAADRGVYGILYVGALPGLRLDAMVGALVRNFVDGRLRTLAAALDDEEAQSCSVLFIPDFCVGADPATQFVKAAVFRLLQRRLHAAQQTVVYAVSASACAAAYGDIVRAHVTEHFLGDPR